MQGVSVVMPVYDAEPLLPRVLPPLLEELASEHVLEIIAVDDGSTDHSARLCREAGLRVIPSGGRLGPGACRNLAVAQAQGDLVLFVDSDVIIHPGVPAKAEEALRASPDIVAVFGSYDERPAARSWVSTYRNLLHHLVHQVADEEASTFWAGLGAVRKAAFQDVGGFDAGRYARPSIEDIELGYRLRERGGRIRLRKDMQGTHLKRWTLRSMVLTDVFKRAVPWSRLLHQRGGCDRHLNVRASEQAKALVACAFWAALLASIAWPHALWIAGGLLLAGWAVNRRLFRLVRNRNGVPNMLVAVPLHQLYYLYSSAAYAWCGLEAVVRSWLPRRAAADLADGLHELDR
jgi:glycosyltransferase involved in cell wall biosynthesis